MTRSYKITNEDEIREYLDKAMKDSKLIPAVFCVSKNTIYEGIKVMGACTDMTSFKKTYTFVNSDTNYRSPVCSIDLSDIGYVHIMEW
jgi:hypothetical protein